MKKAFVIILVIFVCQTAWAVKIDPDKISEKISESIQRAIQEAEANMLCPSNIQVAPQSDESYIVTVDFTRELTAFYDEMNCDDYFIKHYCIKRAREKQKAMEDQFNNLQIKIYGTNYSTNKNCDPLNVSTNQNGHSLYTLSCSFSNSDWISLDVPAVLDDQNNFKFVRVDRDCVNVANPPTSSNSETTDTSTPDTEPNTDPAVDYGETTCGAGEVYNGGTGRCESTRAPHDSFSSDPSNISASTQDEEIPPDASGNPSDSSGGSGKKGWFCSLNRDSGDASLSAIGLLFLVLLVARFRNKIA